jgi:hypothetical protein
MNKFILLAIAGCGILGSCNNSKVPTNCEVVHQGVFAFTAHSKGGDHIPFTIYRNDSIQLEVANGTKDSAFFAITWSNSCAYDLLLLRSTFAMDPALMNMGKSIPMQGTIDYLGNNFHVFTAQRKANGFKMTDTLFLKP